MLELNIEGTELFNELTNEFIYVKPTTLRLEHSLVSISKWESKWKIPFLSANKKTREQTIDYIKCMTMNQNVDDTVYAGITNKHIELINAYIDDSKTATTFNNHVDTLPSRQIMTSEVIYFWMASYNIPFECQKWHLSRLLTLIRIASIENAPKKKMSKQAIMSQNKALNEARRKAMNSKG